MTAEDVRATIRRFVISHFHLSRMHELSDADSLLDARLIDSLGILELVQFLEQTFAIEVTDDDLVPDNFESIAAMARFVESKQ